MTSPAAESDDTDALYTSKPPTRRSMKKQCKSDEFDYLRGDSSTEGKPLESAVRRQKPLSDSLTGIGTPSSNGRAKDPIVMLTQNTRDKISGLSKRQRRQPTKNHLQEAVRLQQRCSISTTATTRIDVPSLSACHLAKKSPPICFGSFVTTAAGNYDSSSFTRGPIARKEKKRPRDDDKAPLIGIPVASAAEPTTKSHHISSGVLRRKRALSPSSKPPADVLNLCDDGDTENEGGDDMEKTVEGAARTIEQDELENPKRSFSFPRVGPDKERQRVVEVVDMAGGNDDDDKKLESKSKKKTTKPPGKSIQSPQIIRNIASIGQSVVNLVVNSMSSKSPGSQGMQVRRCPCR